MQIHHLDNLISLFFAHTYSQILRFFKKLFRVKGPQIFINRLQIFHRSLFFLFFMHKELHKVVQFDQIILFLNEITIEKILVKMHQFWFITGFITYQLLKLLMQARMAVILMYLLFYLLVKVLTKVFKVADVNPIQVNAGCLILWRGLVKKSLTLIGLGVFSLFYLFSRTYGLPNIQFKCDRQFFVLLNMFYNPISIYLQQYISKQMKTQFSIAKALEFVGDNSSYQKQQLFYLGIIITIFATLTCQIPLINSSLGVYFLFFSGVGQFICPVYMSLRTICLGLIGSIGFAIIFYPFSFFMFGLGLCSVGFFGRGFYVSSLIYLNQIGGDRFRAWSTILVLGFWGIAPLLLGVEKLLRFSDIVWLFLFILLPFMIGGALVLKNWRPSPLSLYIKKNFEQTKQVLNEMAKRNRRNVLPYGLKGESGEDFLADYKKITYKDMLSNSFILHITLPLAALWIYRQYIYYSSYIIVPELGNQVTKNLILLSVSQIVAVLMSYPIKLKIKRVNAFFCFVCVITVCSLLSSFTRLDDECRKVGNTCFSKYIYRVSIMLIRFSISLIGSILVNYTLEVYPSDVIKPGFSLCLGLSAIGSAFMPWLVETFIYINLSGFIAFSIFSFAILYFILKLQETNGEMKNSTLNEMESGRVMISLDRFLV